MLFRFSPSFMPPLAMLTVLGACSIGGVPIADAIAKETSFTISEVARLNEPWAMTFLPDGSALITEKSGAVFLWSEGKKVVPISGVPQPAYGGQGGLGDIIHHPDFAKNQTVYLSWVEAVGSNKGAVVGRAKLIEKAGEASFEDMEIIWRQEPKVSGGGHFGHRLAFGPDRMLYISSGERQKFDPSQDMNSNLGKIIRVTDTGETPKDNPFAGQGEIKGQIWSSGHRNPLGIAFDAKGRLWNTEMGPKGGDELNLVKRAANYGYPKASNGSHYSGIDIPDHASEDGFEAPKAWWTPSISPGSLIIYSGNMFPELKGSALIGALSGEALVRVKLDGEKATKAESWGMETRIREVEQGPDGAIWLLEDGENGRLMRLTPKG